MTPPCCAGSTNHHSPDDHRPVIGNAAIHPHYDNLSSNGNKHPSSHDNNQEDIHPKTAPLNSRRSRRRRRQSRRSSSSGDENNNNNKNSSSSSNNRPTQEDESLSMTKEDPRGGAGRRRQQSWLDVCQTHHGRHAAVAASTPPPPNRAATAAVAASSVSSSLTSSSSPLPSSSGQLPPVRLLHDHYDKDDDDDDDPESLPAKSSLSLSTSYPISPPSFVAATFSCRRLSPAIVTPSYNPQQARPELQQILQGRPTATIAVQSKPNPSTTTTHPSWLLGASTTTTTTTASTIPEEEPPQQDQDDEDNDDQQVGMEVVPSPETDRGLDSVWETTNHQHSPTTKRIIPNQYDDDDDDDDNDEEDGEPLLRKISRVVVSDEEPPQPQQDENDDDEEENLVKQHSFAPETEPNSPCFSSQSAIPSPPQQEQQQPPQQHPSSSTFSPTTNESSNHHSPPRLVDWTRHPPSLSKGRTWSEPSATEFEVRGARYFSSSNHPKKQPSLPSVFTCWAVDCIHVSKEQHQSLWKNGGISKHPHERIQQALRQEKRCRGFGSRSGSDSRSDSDSSVRLLPAFVLLVNFIIPAADGQSYYHWVTYLGVEEDGVQLLQDTSTPLGRLTNPFLFGAAGEKDDDDRRRIFKLIPRVVSGNFLVRTAVGTRPTLLGRKLDEKFIFDDDNDNDNDEYENDVNDANPNDHPNPEQQSRSKRQRRRRRFMEIMIDISSNAVANRIVKLVLGYAKCLEIDLMFLLEGGGFEEDEEEATTSKNNNHHHGTASSSSSATTLPERILGGVRIQNIDFVQEQRPLAQQPEPQEF